MNAEDYELPSGLHEIPNEESLPLDLDGEFGSKCDVT
jgi:hypothetical protein